MPKYSVTLRRVEERAPNCDCGQHFVARWYLLVGDAVVAQVRDAESFIVAWLASDRARLIIEG